MENNQGLKPTLLDLDLPDLSHLSELISPPFSVTDHGINSLSNNLKHQFEEAVIEGLKRKGYEFKDRIELEQFIKKHCRCEDNSRLQHRIYYVDDIPFFLHHSGFEIITHPLKTGNPNKIIGELGNYLFL